MNSKLYVDYKKQANKEQNNTDRIYPMYNGMKIIKEKPVKQLIKTKRR